MYNDFIEITIPEDRKALYAELKEKYNPEGSDVRIYQHHLTKTLIEFDTFCKEHDIKYSLAFGTMLGAVRHKGFIPWDDDADLFMDRENYEKLHSLMQGEHHVLTPNLSVAMGIRPELWSPPFAHIDIFILDKSPDCAIIHRIKYIFGILTYSLAKARGRIDSHNFHKIRPWYIFIPFALFGSQNFWKNKLKNVSLWFSDKKSSKYQCYNGVPTYTKKTYQINDCNSYVDMEFENHKFPIYKGYDSILKEQYGDYMELPKNLHIHGIVNNLEIDKFK